MKLIDILALELKEWPEMAREAVGQAQDGSLHLGYAHKEYVGHTSEKYQKADDWETAHVTQAEWRSAVDALKPVSVKFDTSGLPKIGDHVTIIDPDGELIYGLGEQGEVLAYVENTAVVRMSYGLGCFTAKHLRTAEQKRKHAISRLIIDTDWILDETCAAAVIAAGYTKADDK